MATMITVSVKHGPINHEISVPEDSSVAALQQAVETATGVFARKQKLIFKGKVLEAKDQLKAKNIINGSKIMLLAGDGSTQTQVSRAFVTDLAVDIGKP